MIAQQSAFTLHYTYEDLSKLPIYTKCLQEIVIPKECKPILKQKLKCLGITRSSLFMDLDSIGKDIMSQEF